MAGVRAYFFIQVIFLLLLRQYKQEAATNRLLSFIKNAKHHGEEVKLKGVHDKGEDLSEEKRRSNSKSGFRIYTVLSY